MKYDDYKSQLLDSLMEVLPDGWERWYSEQLRYVPDPEYRYSQTAMVDETPEYDETY